MKTQIHPYLSKEQVMEIAQRALQENKWSYDLEFGLQPLWRGPTNDVFGREGQLTSLWIVSFLSPPGPFDQESRYVYVDDEAKSALGILTGHNYFFL